MSKILIHAILENQTENEQYKIETVGIKRENILQYQEQGIRIILTIEKEKIYMKRIQNESQLECTFDKTLTTEGIYDIKSVNMIFSIKVHTKKLQIQNNQIRIEYDLILENEPLKEFSYQLNYEVIS